MSKNNSRLKKIEESLDITDEADKSIPIISWNYGEDVMKYFKDDDEKHSYERWRIARLREERKRQGLIVPIVCNLNEKGVQKYIELFRQQKDLPQTPMNNVIFDLVNYGGSISEDESIDGILNSI